MGCLVWRVYKADKFQPSAICCWTSERQHRWVPLGIILIYDDYEWFWSSRCKNKVDLTPLFLLVGSGTSLMLIPLWKECDIIVRYFDPLSKGTVAWSKFFSCILTSNYILVITSSVVVITVALWLCSKTKEEIPSRVTPTRNLLLYWINKFCYRNTGFLNCCVQLWRCTPYWYIKISGKEVLRIGIKNFIPAARPLQREREIWDMMICEVDSKSFEPRSLMRQHGRGCMASL